MSYKAFQGELLPSSIQETLCLWSRSFCYAESVLQLSFVSAAERFLFQQLAETSGLEGDTATGEGVFSIFKLLHTVLPIIAVENDDVWMTDKYGVYQCVM